ncbi:MAG: D-alanine--D-alanine ligase [Treponema sp.]|jgi:D-alanine-D-alanine ligase|nr:D-alanine--D-alanine ligase [Treponema sp.]
MNVLVMGGGKSGEHEVSLVSAAAIIRNIDIAKHTVYAAGVSKDGRWFLQDDRELERLRNDKTASLRIAEDTPLSVVPGEGLFAQGKRLPADIVFPALHGTFGEDGTIQGLFELAELPYAGCGVLASSVAMDKEKTKLLWTQAKLPVVPWVTVAKADERRFALLLDEAESQLGYPLFVKPANAGSSVGISKAKDRTALEAALGEALKWDDKVLIEKAVDAREIECSIIGDGVLDGDITVYAAGEVSPRHEFYDYDAKYTDPEGAALLIPAQLNADKLTEVREIAAKAYAALDCSGLSRLDFFLDKKTGALYLNEINTMPGFTPISMFPKICAQAGLSYPDLIEHLLQAGIRRFRARRSLSTSLLR